MIVNSVPGVYGIVDYNTNRFYFGCSRKSMYDRVRNHMWRIEDGSHESKGLNYAYAHNHDLEYATIMNFSKSIHPKKIREKRNQLIQALETFNMNFGFNGPINASNNVVQYDTGLYIIIALNKNNGLRKFYIGQSTEIRKRLEKHQYDLLLGSHQNTQLQDDFNRKRIYEFEFKPLITFGKNEISFSELSRLEVHLIFVLKTYLESYGYNKNARGICIHKR